MSNFRFLRGLRNLSLSTLGRVRPNSGQESLRRYSSNETEESLSSIARVAKEYRDIYAPKETTQEDPDKDPKDRSVPVPVEVSIRYLKSDAYKTTYGTAPVWVPYRRNFKGQLPPSLTRLTCIRKGRLATNNPCPICRDEYLVLHYKNVALLKQFLNALDGSVLPLLKTNICQMQHENLLTALLEAKDLGLLTYDVPFRVYNYEHYKPKKSESN